MFRTLGNPVLDDPSSEGTADHEPPPHPRAPQRQRARSSPSPRNDKPVARLSPVTIRTSLRDLKPVSVGAVLKPFTPSEAGTLGEMLDPRQ
ncbi:MAG TPA: hypothetical protein VEC99_00015 [Clostridia bacterium]|nr:hypothetical protein [Clostridia bacterium]